MSGKAEEAKGRIKEAAGALIDDDKLRREGQNDQTAGKAKQAVADAAENVKRAAERVIEKARDAAS